jgi:hypothetical protein
MCLLTQKVCKALNEGLEADQESIQWIMDRRKLLKQVFAKVKAPFVCGFANGKKGAMMLGPLGLINTVLIQSGCTCRIAAYYERGKLSRFSVEPFSGAACKDRL